MRPRLVSCALLAVAVYLDKGQQRREEMAPASPANQGRQDVKHADEESAGLVRPRSRELEFEGVETGQALDCGTARYRVMARAFTGSGASRAFRDVQRNRDRGAVELIRELGAAKREPANDVTAEVDGEGVGVEAME